MFDAHTLSTAIKVAPVAALLVSGLMWVTSRVSDYSSNTKQTSDNSAQIEQLRQEVEAHQQQLDHEAATQEQLKAIASQNQEMQQEIHELSTNLTNFEQRFIVVPNQTYSQHQR